MSLDQIADLFKVMEWKWDVDNEYQSPDPENLSRMIAMLINSVEKSDTSICFTNMGRLMVYTDPDFPSFFSVCVEVGLIAKIEESEWNEL
jgi:hypothetical protein